MKTSLPIHAERQICVAFSSHRWCRVDPLCYLPQASAAGDHHVGGPVHPDKGREACRCGHGRRVHTAGLRLKNEAWYPALLQFPGAIRLTLPVIDPQLPEPGGTWCPSCLTPSHLSLNRSVLLPPPASAPLLPWPVPPWGLG